jgi:hypothetical protein
VWNKLSVRCRHRWDDIIIINVREIVWEEVKWIQLAQNRVQWWTFLDMVMEFSIPVPQYSELTPLAPNVSCRLSQM